MYNKFDIEAFIGDSENLKEKALVMSLMFDGNSFLWPIIQGNMEEGKLHSIVEHIRIANKLTQDLITEEKEKEDKQIIIPK